MTAQGGGEGEYFLSVREMATKSFYAFKGGGGEEMFYHYQPFQPAIYTSTVMVDNSLIPVYICDENGNYKPNMKTVTVLKIYCDYITRK